MIKDKNGTKRKGPVAGKRPAAKTQTISDKWPSANVDQLNGGRTEAAAAAATTTTTGKLEVDEPAHKKSGARVKGVARVKQKRRRRRRSLFAALFAQSRHKSSDECSCASSSLSSLVSAPSYGRKGRLARQLHDRDIVLIRPAQAKCVEATVASLVDDDDEDDIDRDYPELDGRIEKSRTEEEKQVEKRRKSGVNSSSLFNRGMRRLKLKKASIDEDADSYVLDLNDCLDREKLRMSSSASLNSHNSCSISSFSSSWHSSGDFEKTNGEPIKAQISERQSIISGAEGISSETAVREKSVNRLSGIRADGKLGQKECSPVRETSPIDELWQTNEEYIPAGEKNNNQQLDHRLRLEKATGAATKRARQQQASPTLLEFLQSHQIHLDVINSLPLSTKGQRTDGPASSGSSSRDSLRTSSNWFYQSKLIRPASATAAGAQPAPVPLPPPPPPPLGGTKLSELSESDRRLYHWRRLAARSVNMWQVPEDSSSDNGDEDDDSDSADILDCERRRRRRHHQPAMVCYCSDDTSCSSVELFWSPRAPNVRLADQERGQARVSASEELQRQRAPLMMERTPARLALAPPSRSITPTSGSDLNLSTSVSPLNRSQSPAPVQRPGSRSPSAPAHSNRLGPRQVYSMAGLQPGGYLADGTNSSNKSDSNSNRSVCQRPSILELAKPLRARDRRIGANDEDDFTRHRYRRIRKSKTDGPINQQQQQQPVVLQRRNAAQDKKLDPNRRRSTTAVSSIVREYERLGDGDGGGGGGGAELTPGSGAREWSAVPTSRPVSTSDWLSNPLFGRVRGRTASPHSEPVRVQDSSASSSLAKARAVDEDADTKCQADSTKCSPPPLVQQQAKSCEEPSLGRRLLKESMHLLRRHSSVADDLHKRRDGLSNQVVQDASKDKASSNSKSNKFMTFLARIKARQETPATHMGELIINEAEVDRERLDTISMNGFGLSGGRGPGRRHRWSLRMKSPFAVNSAGNNNNNSNNNSASATASEYAYLSQMSANLDRLKSQLGERLSDTGKRASVLADQLISTIKDTAKEQFVQMGAATSVDTNCDTLPNSFATNKTTEDPLVVRKHLLKEATADAATGDRSKARMFSLIYKHQQQQVDGRPVITRQPTSKTLAATPQPPVAASIDSERAQVVDFLATDNHERLPDLDELLDPRALLEDKFRALSLKARKSLQRGRHSICTNTVGASRTIELRRMSSDQTSARVGGLSCHKTEPGVDQSKSRRASCTV